MSGAEEEAPRGAAAAPGGSKRWFRPTAGPRLSADEAKREGRIVRLAMDGLGAQAAQAFLNTFDEALDGRPLAVAARSEDGAEAVERLIASLRSPPAKASGG